MKTTLAAAVLLAAGAAHAVPMLTLDPAAAALMPGETITLALAGSDFAATAGGGAIDNVSGGQKVDLAFSAGLLELTGVTIDPRWTFAAGNKTGTIDQAAGTLTGLSFATFPATADDAFAIATLTFRALAPGNAAVALTGAQLVGRVAGLAGQTIGVDLGSAAIAVSAVPEPATWALWSAALGVVALRRMRRQGREA